MDTTDDPAWTISTSDTRRAPPPDPSSAVVVLRRDSPRPPPAPPDDDGDPPDPAGEDVDTAERQMLRGPPSAYRSISWNPIIPSSEAL